MDNQSSQSNRPQHQQLLAWLHDAIPEKPDSTIAPLDGLPPIEWASVGVSDWQKPKPVDLRLSTSDWEPSAPLPKADVIVMTWTVAEWAALDHVFCSYDLKMRVSDVEKAWWREPWCQYSRDYYTIHQYMEDVKATWQGHAPSLSKQAWGLFRMVEIAGLQVLLIKSEMHLAQDGTDLPLCQFVAQVCDEAQPGLFLSIGTAGGVREEDALGCALITNQACFHLLEDFRNASFNGKTYQSDWKIPTDLIDTAQKMVIQVAGYEILPISPQYPAGAHISPNAPDSRLKIVDSPIITTDSFLFGTTKNELDDIGCIVEMDNAVIGMVCQNKTAFGFVRNVSDPVINGDLPDAVQEAWATYIYQQRGLYTSFNGALDTWAVIAGGHQPPE